MKKRILFSAILLASLLMSTTIAPVHQPMPSADLFSGQERAALWADSLLAGMTRQEMIGQLFMVAAYSNKDEKHYQAIEKMVREQHLGGLIFFQGGPLRQAALTNRYQAAARYPLLIAMDAEWGLGMRLDSTMSFPKQLTLGAISSNSYVYNMGIEVARHLRRLGVHVNFAPVVDINSNPANPVIGYRSFGEDKYNVAYKGMAYAKGMQSQGVVACAKHFPGHGDTDKDSHYTLPVIKHDRNRFRQMELFPFEKLFADSVMSVMVAHLHVPSYDDRPNMPTTLSPTVVTTLLRDTLRFQGLAFTDALNMQGVAGFFKPGEADLKAFMAGNDVLLFPTDPAKGIEAISRALDEGQITEADIRQRVRKILMAKHFAGLGVKTPVQTKGLAADLNAPSAQALKATLYEQAVTVARNESNLLPILKTEGMTFASLTIGAGATFQRYLGKYASFKQFSSADSRAELEKLLPELKKYSVVVVGLHHLNQKRDARYGMSPDLPAFLEKLQQHTKVVTVAFGNPYALGLLEAQQHLVCGYENDTLMQRAVPQVLFGALGAYGKLPVSASAALPEGTGVVFQPAGKMGFVVPEQVGFSSAVLARIDSIAMEAIRQEATPGCQVLVAHNGKVVYERSFGHHTYARHQAVTDETLYDLASLTKVLSSTAALMRMEEKGLFDLYRPLAEYFPELAGTNKAKMQPIDILCHQAGLKSFIPYWTMAKRGRKFLPEYIQTVASDSFPVEIMEGVYARPDIRELMWAQTVASDMANIDRVKDKYRYFYSDVGYYFFERIVEKETGFSLDEYVDRELYRPLGLDRLTYRPLRRFSKDEIAPTEMDLDFRGGLVHGHVHDPGAALAGGVAGHAGLFGNALSVGVLMQMMVQGGRYGGKQYLSPLTVGKYTGRPFAEGYNNRRGIGWDKPTITDKKSGPTSAYCSDYTFGHTGFTGTCAWADPAYNLVYVFLSNRVYPYVGNRKLIQTNVRGRIQDVVYEAMGVLPAKANIFRQ